MNASYKHIYTAPAIQVVAFKVELGNAVSQGNEEDEITWIEDNTAPQGRSFSRETFSSGDNDNWDNYQ